MYLTHNIGSASALPIIMYELAVCSDGMTEAQPRSFRQNRPASEYITTESVNSAPIKRGETEVQICWQGKAQSSSPILRCTFLARRSAKLVANFSATMVTSLPSFSLCISLSLSVSHRMYLTHNIGSASALPIIMYELAVCSDGMTEAQPRSFRQNRPASEYITTESVNSAPIKRGETEVQICWQGKAQSSSPILRCTCTFLARRSAKLVANFSATMVTSLPSFSLCISLSLTECTSRTI